jgi:hypothetical protein
MSAIPSRTLYPRAAIMDQVRSADRRDPSKLPIVIVFAATIGTFPLAYALDGLLGIGWLASAFGALMLAAILAASACAMVPR